MSIVEPLAFWNTELVVYKFVGECSLCEDRVASCITKGNEAIFKAREEDELGYKGFL